MVKIDKFHNYVDSNSEFLRILRHLPSPEEKGPWVAGGSVWKSVENVPLTCDIDFFFASPQQYEVYSRIINSIPYVNHILSENKSKFSTTFDFHIYNKQIKKTQKVQFIHFKFWPSVKELIGDFDFTACQFAYDGDNLYMGDYSLQHVKERKIFFNTVRNVQSTAFHLKRYLDLGFTITSEEQQKLDDLINCVTKIKKDDLTPDWEEYNTNEEWVARWDDDALLSLPRNA